MLSLTYFVSDGRTITVNSIVFYVYYECVFLILQYKGVDMIFKVGGGALW
jgi:hypothetical protein